MKTQKIYNSISTRIRNLFGILSMFLILTLPTNAQVYPPELYINMILGDDQFFECAQNNHLHFYMDSVQPNSAPNKRTLKRSMKMLAALIGQPFISIKSRKDGPYDVIIVPGYPYRDGKRAGMILCARLKWAHYLLSKGIAKHVILSGSAVYTPYVESQVMALCLEEMGIPPDRIHCETRAEHSTENVVYSYRMARELGFEKIAIATGPFQSAFLQPYVKAQELPVRFLSITSISKGRSASMAFEQIDPSTALTGDFVSLKDRESRSERLQGTMGNHIAVIVDKDPNWD